MFNITNYNTVALFIVLIINFTLISFYLKNKITSIIDPLVYEILWLSSNISFLLVFSFQYGFNPFSIIFLFSFFLYIFILKKQLISNNVRYFKKVKIVINKNKIFLVYVMSLALLLYSKVDLFIYMIENDFSHWFLYRFVDLQGRNPILRIINIGVVPVFLYISFLYIFFLKKYKFIISLLLIGYIILLLLGGGRSSLLSIIFAFGIFLIMHRNIYTKKELSKINIYSSIFVFISILFIIVISSMYKTDSVFMDGVNIFLNRVMANADGLEYYMRYNGYDNIQSGFFSYIMSFLGIYIKRILDIDYINIGQQLSELVVRHSLDFAQGSNYTLPLQVMVFGYYFYPIYVVLISLVVIKMRNQLISNSFSKNIRIYYLLSLSFGPIHDLEYFMLRIISCILIYFIFFYPILNINYSLILRKKI